MSSASLINPADSVERQNEKLLHIADALMRRIENQTAQSGAAYAQFERAALLEKRVRQRTEELERTLDLLQESNAQLARANAEAQDARRDLADAIETVQEGFALFDPDDRLVMFNSRFCRDFRDVAPRLTRGMSFVDYIDHIAQSRCLALPESDSPEGWRVRRLARHADRNVMFNVELTHDRWLQVSEQRTSKGGTVVLQTDVTDLVRIERQERARLESAQTRMIQATLDHINQGVAIFDEAGRLLGWNRRIGTLLSVPARLMQLGVTFDAIIGQLGHAFDFLGGVDRATFRAWAAARHKSEEIDFEVRHGRRDVLHVFGSGLPDGGFLVSVTDVTAEREAAQRLFEINEMLEQRVMERTLELEDALSAAERANASKNRFVAAASHDLLQPLSAAELFIASLADRLPEETDRQVLNKAGSAIKSAVGLIDALLDISRLDSDKQRFDIRPVALNEVFGPLRDEMEVLAAEKGLDFRIVPCGVTVESDPTYLRRIIQNLAANAIRYTDRGRVLIGARRQGNALRIEVHDSGPGIAEDDQDSIFEEFHRLDATASRNDGLGLGLAIVERACARLGHPLGLWSEVGRGSCFRVSVPVAGRAKALKIPPPRRDRVDLGRSGLIVLLVENEPELRRAIQLLMESWGVDVIDADTAEAALALIEDLGITPDVMVLDYQLGAGLTGTELLSELTRRFGPRPALILTADRSETVARACEAQGVERMLKPLDRGRLGAFLTEAAQSLP
ncbi:PAS-domain containing protein [Roseivivax sp. GX 12232]|uniref:hybrid sensor histidine kinase/response regulator n=1 Tax=Roseivivax sp. GX 12232 TaxID=2900547 RepID=UPI001E647C62|nr:PAS-domain containing protein [Roseivivax sp. GX 12232]MCE0504718.1 PAS-domain containing protein [Roseivivax sp. GX 12232]